VFGGVFSFLFLKLQNTLVFKGRILDGSRCQKKKPFSTRKRGHYCTLLCNIPLPDPFYCLQYCAIYFPHDPLYCNKILAISCKGQWEFVISTSPTTASSRWRATTTTTTASSRRATTTIRLRRGPISFFSTRCSREKNLLIPAAAGSFSLNAALGLLATRRRLGRRGDSFALRSAFVV